MSLTGLSTTRFLIFVKEWTAAHETPEEGEEVP